MLCEGCGKREATWLAISTGEAYPVCEVCAQREELTGFNLIPIEDAEKIIKSFQGLLNYWSERYGQLLKAYNQLLKAHSQRGE